jgi:hypothetical protein
MRRIRDKEVSKFIPGRCQLGTQPSSGFEPTLVVEETLYVGGRYLLSTSYRAGEAGCRTDFSNGISGIFTKRRMSWRSFIAELYPQRDLAEFTIWEIDQLNFELIYPHLRG